MKKNKIKTGLLALLMATPAVPLCAQSNTAQFEGETTVNVVEVPVRVVDKKTGKPVTDLAASDFVIRENGTSQVITNFVEISTHIHRIGHG